MLKFPIAAVVTGALIHASALLAQQPQAIAAPSAEPVVLAWEQAFPVTPRFSEWTKAGSASPGLSGQATSLWMHRSSVKWISSNHLSVDAMLYIEPSASSPATYGRARINVTCDFHYAIQFDAAAKVVIDPEGTIRPISDVQNSLGAAYPGLQSVYKRLCSDPSFRMQFGADH